MVGHVLKVYKNSGLKPAVKAALHDLTAASSRRKQRLEYIRCSFSEEQRENTVLSGYCIVKTKSVRLHMDMVCELCEAIEGKKPAVIYTDELRNGELLYKPDFAPDNLAAHNYIGNCVVVRQDLLDDYAKKLSGEESLWNFNKYICGKCSAKEIVHVSRALFEDSADAAHGYEAAYKIADDRAWNMDDVSGNGKTADIGQEYNDKSAPLISVIIPNYEHTDDLRRCVESLLYINTYRNIEIIIVENNSSSHEIFAYYDELLKEHADVVRLEKWEGSFNYSAINNYGAGCARGELLLLLNNDTKLIEPDSLREMAKFAVRENTGAVGACLLYEDKTIQHAGVIVGIGPDRTAVHPNSGVSFIEEGYRGSIHHVQNYSAVTGACLMVRKEIFEKLHGLDEELAVAYNDVDFCLRLRETGLLNVYVPQALLFHYESRSRGYDDRGERHERFLRESDKFRARWQHIIDDGDPYYNRNLSKNVPWKIEL